MISFNKKLYLSENCDDLIRIKISVKLGRGMFNVYLLGINDANNQLEMFDSALLKQNKLYYRNITVYGIAKGKEAGIELVKQITDDCFAATDSYDLISYLKSISS